MKSSNLSKVVGASVLSLSMALLPLTMPAHAQSGGSTGGSGTSGSTNSTDTTNTRSGAADYNRNNNDFDWGWLGLLGLIGLAGLTGRKHQEPARYRDPEEATRPGSRL